ncbi:hypothetical protein SE91_08480 [Bradyrhizobium sp. DOA1]|nr:hypothetical protein SE91_08480 [Bradyrhizobium sp. DOA1]
MSGTFDRQIRSLAPRQLILLLSDSRAVVYVRGLVTDLIYNQLQLGRIPRREGTSGRFLFQDRVGSKFRYDGTMGMPVVVHSFGSTTFTRVGSIHALYASGPHWSDPEDKRSGLIVGWDLVAASRLRAAMTSR